MKITKKEIVRAILTERLEARQFFNSKNGDDNGKCKVCAVGAVLRHKNIKSDSAGPIVTQGCYIATDMSSAYFSFIYDENTFLGILSSEFEGYNLFKNYKATEDELRLHALMIVEGLCPNEIEVNL